MAPAAGLRTTTTTTTTTSSTSSTLQPKALGLKESPQGGVSTAIVVQGVHFGLAALHTGLALQAYGGNGNACLNLCSCPSYPRHGGWQQGVCCPCPCRCRCCSGEEERVGGVVRKWGGGGGAQHGLQMFCRCKGGQVGCACAREAASCCCFCFRGGCSQRRAAPCVLHPPCGAACTAGAAGGGWQRTGRGAKRQHPGAAGLCPGQCPG